MQALAAIAVIIVVSYLSAHAGYYKGQLDLARKDLAANNRIKFDAAIANSELAKEQAEIKRLADELHKLREKLSR